MVIFVMFDGIDWCDETVKHFFFIEFGIIIWNVFASDIPIVRSMKSINFTSIIVEIDNRK